MTRANFLAPDFRGNVVTGVGNPAGDTDAINRAWALANKGVTILTGTGVPGSGLGAEGNYYLDTNADILYGPKAGPPGTYGPDQSLYTSQTPDNQTITTGTWGQEITFASDGRVTALRHYRTSNAAYATATLRMWSPGGAQLAMAVTPTESGTGWKTAVLGTPVAVTAGQTVRVTYEVSSDARALRIPAVLFTNGDLTSGVSYYSGSVGAFPSLVENSYTFMADVVYAVATGVIWPIAIRSVPPGGTASQVLAKSSSTDYAADWVTPAAGSVILSGTATPIGSTGNVGEYYLDKDDQILYGPKASNSFGAPASAIGATPAGNSVNNYANRSFGMRFQIMTNGRITKLRLHNPGGSMNGYSRLMHLWSDAGALLAQASTTNETGPGWVEATLTTPVAVTAGTFYRVSYNMPLTTYFSYTIGAPVSASPHFTTLAPYVADALSTFPSSLTATDDRYADVVFEPDLGTPWPVALKSIPAGAGTILSGTAVPTGAIGAIGDYYLDTDDRILYGPKIVQPPEEYITQPAADATTSPNMIGGKYQFAVPGYVVGVRFFISAAATVLNASEVYLFSAGGTMLASKDAPLLTAGIWNTVYFDTPISVAAATQYMAACWFPSGCVPVYKSGGGWAGATSGNVTALSAGATYHNTRDTYPASDGGIGAPYVSPIFTVGQSPWLVALKSVPPGGTTSQVLAKTSATDYAASWSTPAAASVLYTADVGAVTAGTPLTITHSLGTLDVLVQVIEKNTAGAGAAVGQVVFPTIIAATTNTITLTFAETKAANLYRVIVRS